jgi:hypothetical protein
MDCYKDSDMGCVYRRFGRSVTAFEVAIAAHVVATAAQIAAIAASHSGGLGSNGTENGVKAFSFLNTRSDSYGGASPSAALGGSTSSAPVAAQPTHGDDALEHPEGLILCRRAPHSTAD